MDLEARRRAEVSGETIALPTVSEFDRHIIKRFVDLLPSGRRGLILGEIFGRIAGLTCDEELLCRFLLSRPLTFDGSERLLGNVDVNGVVVGPSRGLGKTELVAVSGALAVA